MLTLKNFGRFALAAAIVFLGLTLQSELRSPRSDNYGRLFGKQVSGQPAVAPKVDVVVHEAPVEDQTAADPLLVEPAAREQYLGVTSSIEPPGEPALHQEPDVHVDGPVITGPNGVMIVRGGKARQPLLSGGIFRQ